MFIGCSLRFRCVPASTLVLFGEWAGHTPPRSVQSVGEKQKEKNHSCKMEKMENNKDFSHKTTLNSGLDEASKGLETKSTISNRPQPRSPLVPPPGLVRHHAGRLDLALIGEFWPAAPPLHVFFLFGFIVTLSSPSVSCFSGCFLCPLPSDDNPQECLIARCPRSSPLARGRR